MSLDLFITNVCINPTFMLSLVINVFTYTFFSTKHDSLTRKPKESRLIGALSTPIIKSNEKKKKKKKRGKNPF